MKTPAQILNEHTPLDKGYHSSWIIKAMKEYAKQWVERITEVALMDEEVRGFDGVIIKADSHKEYKFNSQKFKYILTVDKDSILNVKKEIDAQ